MKMSLGFILVFIIFLSSCSPISSRVSERELALDPVKQEAFNEMNNWLNMFVTYNADHTSEFYSDNAFIPGNWFNYTPKALEKKFIKDLRKFYWMGVSMRFEIESLEIVEDKVVFTVMVMQISKKRTTKKLRWYVWKKIDGRWKIISHTPYPPQYISEEDRVAHGLKPFSNF